MFSKIFTGLAKEEWRDLRAEHRFLQSRVAELSTALSTSSGVALSARIAELETALETMRMNQRRELGRLWKLIGNDAHDPRNTPAPNGHSGNDDIDALLRLQSAPPASPGGRQ